MGFIEKPSDGGKYRARYRDPLGRQRSRSFARKADAQRFFLEIEADKTRGTWIDPRGPLGQLLQLPVHHVSRLAQLGVEEHLLRTGRKVGGEQVHTAQKAAPRMGSTVWTKAMAGQRSAPCRPPRSSLARTRPERHAVCNEWILLRHGAGPSHMRLARLIGGPLLCLVGAVWFLQGIGLFGGSAMTDERQWAYIGGVAVLAGVAILTWPRFRASR